MGMSFFNHALTKTNWEAASHQCTQTKFLEDNDELLVHTVWSGTLMPLVRGHDVKKDISMLNVWSLSYITMWRPRSTCPKMVLHIFTLET